MTDCNANLSTPRLRTTRIPPEVVGSILSKLGKSDMLRCRLVNRTWNQESLRQLRFSRWRRSVKNSDLNAALNFLKNSSSENFFLPFELTFDHTAVIKNPIEAKEISIQVAKDFEALLELCASNSVPDVVLICNSPMNVTQILRTSSPGLRKLTVEFYGDKSSQLETALEILADKNLSFPNLQVLWSRDHPLNVTGPELYLTDAIVQKSPYLKQLCCIPFINFVNFDQTKVTYSLKNLQKLKFTNMSNLVSFLAIFRGKPAQDIPALTSLERTEHVVALDSPPEAQEAIILHDALNLFSRTLSSLVIAEFKTHSAELGGILQFPRMPSLKNFRLTMGTKRVDLYVNAEQLNFTQDTFPALENLEIDFGFDWRDVDLKGFQTAPRNCSATMNSVSSLILVMPTGGVVLKAGRNKNSWEILRQYIDGLQNTFPNANKFGVHNFENMASTPIPIFQALVDSAYSLKIETFELKDSYLYYFASAVGLKCKIFGKRSHLENITKLRFCLSDKFTIRQQSIVSTTISFSIQAQDIAYIVDNFPKVLQIDISLLWWELSGAGLPNPGRLASMFSNLIINTI